MRRAASLLLGILFLFPFAPAAAQTVGRCYPPPCAVEPSATVPAGPPAVSSVTVGGTEAAAERSPVPVVATGLLAVVGSLTVVGLRRRSHIVRRSSSALPAPAAVGTVTPPEPQPALR